MGANMSISGLKPVVDGTPVKNPAINTTILFNTDTELSVPKTCNSILQAARSAGSTEAFLEIYKIGDSAKIKRSFEEALGKNTSHAIKESILFSLFNGIPYNLSNFLSGLSSPTIDQTQAVDVTPEYPMVDTYLTALETSQIPVIRLVASCLDEESKQNPKTLSDAKQRYETSQARYESVSNDPAAVSYYEGWFPIFRPLKEVSLFILFAFGLLFLIFSVLTFMFMQGIELKFSLPALSESSLDFSIGQYRGYIYGGLGIGAAITLFGLWRKWF